jgi:hypothetical protein
MTPEESERLQGCIQEMSEILYRNTPADALTTLETIEQTVRQQMLEQVSPKVGVFLSKRQRAQHKAKPEQ